MCINSLKFKHEKSNLSFLNFIIIYLQYKLYILLVVTAILKRLINIEGLSLPYLKLLF